MPRMDKTARKLDETFASIKTSLSIRGAMKTRRVTLLAWMAFCLVLIANLLSFVTFIAPGWTWTREIRGREEFEGECYGHYGLFFACWTLVSDPTRRYCHILNTLGGLPGWWKGVQAMAAIALMSCVGSFASLCAYIFVKAFNQSHFIITSIVTTSFISTVFSIPLFIIFCTQFLGDAYWCCEGWVIQMVEYHLYYCFVIAAGTPLFHLFGALVALKELHTLRNPKLQQLTQDDYSEQPSFGSELHRFGPQHPFFPRRNDEYNYPEMYRDPRMPPQGQYGPDMYGQPGPGRMDQGPPGMYPPPGPGRNGQGPMQFPARVDPGGYSSGPEMYGPPGPDRIDEGVAGIDMVDQTPPPSMEKKKEKTPKKSPKKPKSPPRREDLNETPPTPMKIELGMFGPPGRSGPR